MPVCALHCKLSSAALICTLILIRCIRNVLRSYSIYDLQAVVFYGFIKHRIVKWLIQNIKCPSPNSVLIHCYLQNLSHALTVVKYTKSNIQYSHKIVAYIILPSVDCSNLFSRIGKTSSLHSYFFSKCNRSLSRHIKLIKFSLIFSRCQIY